MGRQGGPWLRFGLGRRHPSDRRARPLVVLLERSASQHRDQRRQPRGLTRSVGRAPTTRPAASVLHVVVTCPCRNGGFAKRSSTAWTSTRSRTPTATASATSAASSAVSTTWPVSG